MNKYMAAVVVMSIACSPLAHAQDPVFSQAYLSPVYMNPAATGAGDYDLRFSAMYKRQWMSIPSAITYTAFSVDKFMPKLRGGFGLMGTYSSEGYLKRRGLYGSYAYTICSEMDHASNLDESKWFVSGGIQGGIAQTRIDYGKLVFDDQIDAGGVIPGAVSAAEPPVHNNRWYGDIAAGFLFNYYLDDFHRVLIGGSAHHINTPDESLTSTSNGNRSEIPMRWTGHFLYTWMIPQSDWSLNISGIYYQQQRHNALQFGTEVINYKYDLNLGIWYRGNVNFKEMDAVSVGFSIGIFGKSETNKLKVGLAHDAPVGQNRYSRTTGSSELGFVWDVKTYDQNTGGVCKPKINCKCDCPN